MAKPEWNRYFSLSLLAHLLILSLGGALLYAHRSLPETPQESIRVHLAGPDRGRGNAGTPGKGKDSAAQQGNGTAHAGTGEQDRLLEQLMEAPSRVNDRGVVERPERNGARVSGGEQAGVSPSSGGSGETGGSGNLAGNGQGNGSGGPGAGDGSGASQGGGESLEDRSRDASLESYSKIYPQAARASGEEGTAQVGVEISAGGEVLSAWLESSTGYDRLDRAALKSARQWTFSPALDAAGHPVPSRKSVTVVYSLTE